ncbi:uncharacterized protein LOC125875116 isoform X2 [Solanum stenotomum]|uniref:uncharacterized protein LOC125875116 isoform X2 n=1 Tax=Solanum stenotomum TaxID=172797 RepID=UPI0020D00898|nr:uncharacterized protein LOC125875116 isoform X2 [Solanum stenotomum]
MGSKKCQVCDEVQSKYKCPNCFIPFCSLVCFKKHKEIPCGKPEPEPESEPVSEEKLAPAPALHVEKPIYVDEPGEAVNQSQLESIASLQLLLQKFLRLYGTKSFKNSYTTWILLWMQRMNLTRQWKRKNFA